MSDTLFEEMLRDPPGPLGQLIGNNRARKRLARIAWKIRSRPDRSGAGMAFALLGPASTGKTTMARCLAQEVDLPFCEIQPQEVSSVGDIWAKIRDDVEGAVIDTVEGFRAVSLRSSSTGLIQLPPSVVFIDEVHALSRKCEQGLLKAVENSDRRLVTEDGEEIDCEHVCWCVATTDRGDLFDAFDTRFVKIHLRLYSRPEIAQIVRLVHAGMPWTVCQLVAKYAGIVPREALAFAREVEMEREMSGIEWADACRVVAEDQGIDPQGMTLQRLEILSHLGHGPIAANRLAAVAQCKERELRRFVLPPLLAITPDQPVPLVTVTSKGYTVTPAGLRELEARDIPFDYNAAVPKSIRSRYK